MKGFVLHKNYLVMYVYINHICSYVSVSAFVYGGLYEQKNRHMSVGKSFFFNKFVNSN